MCSKIILSIAALVAFGCFTQVSGGGGSCDSVIALASSIYASSIRYTQSVTNQCVSFLNQQIADNPTATKSQFVEILSPKKDSCYNEIVESVQNALRQIVAQLNVEGAEDFLGGGEITEEVFNSFPVICIHEIHFAFYNVVTNNLIQIQNIYDAATFEE